MKKTTMCAAIAIAFAACADGIAVKDGDAIAFLGDSITASGNRPAGYINLVMKGLEVAGLKGVKKIPSGMGGQKSSGMVARVEKD